MKPLMSLMFPVFPNYTTKLKQPTSYMRQLDAKYFPEKCTGFRVEKSFSGGENKTPIHRSETKILVGIFPTTF